VDWEGEPAQMPCGLPLRIVGGGSGITDLRCLGGHAWCYYDLGLGGFQFSRQRHHDQLPAPEPPAGETATSGARCSGSLDAPGRRLGGGELVLRQRHLTGPRLAVLLCAALVACACASDPPRRSPVRCERALGFYLPQPNWPAPRWVLVCSDGTVRAIAWNGRGGE
jgi:hypothetical protein